MLTYINPFIAQADVAPAEVLCASESSLNTYCKFRSEFVLPTTGLVFGFDDTTRRRHRAGDRDPGEGRPGHRRRRPRRWTDRINVEEGMRVPLDIAPGEPVAFGSTNESIWERTVIAWSVLSVVFLLLSVQFVSPTRRWRLRRGPSAVPNPEAMR